MRRGNRCGVQSTPSVVAGSHFPSRFPFPKSHEGPHSGPSRTPRRSNVYASSEACLSTEIASWTLSESALESSMRWSTSDWSISRSIPVILAEEAGSTASTRRPYSRAAACALLLPRSDLETCFDGLPNPGSRQPSLQSAGGLWEGWEADGKKLAFFISHLAHFASSSSVTIIDRKMSPPSLQKTVEIVQASWKQIVREQRLKLAISLVKGGELQLAPRFDARRAPWRAPVVARDAPTDAERAARQKRDRRDLRGPRASDVGLFHRRSTRA